MAKVSDNRVRGVRSSIPSNVVIGRIDKGTGKAQLLDSTALRRILGPGFIKAVSGSGSAAALTQNHIFVGNASNLAADVAMSGDATIVASGALTLANTAVTPSTYGDATHVPQITVDSKGRLTAASNVAITLSTPLTQNHIFVGNASNVATDVAMSGDATIVASGALTLANTAVTPSTYGDSTHVAQFTVDSKGRLTAASNVAISGGGGGSTDVNPFSDGGITKPVASDFTIADDATVNHGTGSKADLATRGVEFTQTHGTGGSTQSFYYRSAISSTLDTAIAYVMPNFNELASTGWFIGLGVRDNTGKIHAFGIRGSTGSGAANTVYSEARYTDISTFSSLSSETAGYLVGSRPFWIKVQKVSTNFVFSVSFNGETYFTVKTVSATAFVGATLNDVGFLVVNNLGVSAAIINFDCFSFTRT